ncbi:MAG: hypothetical protein ACYTFO_03395 [Planctomycetota bacterium]|jgi:hypothetical protein
MPAVMPTPTRHLRWIVPTILLCCAVGAALAEEATTQPAEPPLVAVERILALTPMERDALEATLVREGQMIDSILYPLLAKTASLPELTAEDRNNLPRPLYAALLAQPGSYAARPIRLRVIVLIAREIKAGSDQLGATPDWPQGRQVWMLDGFVAEGDSKALGRPIRILSVVNPFKQLGRNRRLEDDDEWHFSKPGPQVEITGVFYKIWQAETRDSDERSRQSRSGSIELEQTQRFPIVLAWQFGTPIQSDSGTSGLMALAGWGVALAGAMVLVVILFVSMRRTQLRRRAVLANPRAWWGEYKPRRDTDEDESDIQEDDDIDPAVKAAAEAYRRQRAADETHGPNGNG